MQADGSFLLLIIHILVYNVIKIKIKQTRARIITNGENVGSKSEFGRVYIC